MTITMGPRTDITETGNQQTSFEPHGSSNSGGLGALWVAIVALAATVALAFATALGAFDTDSSEVDGTAVQNVDPRADADFHRPVVVPSAPAVAAAPAHPQAWEELISTSAPAAPAQPSSPQAYEELVSDTSAGHYVNSGLDPETQAEIYRQASQANAPADPRDDADHHREAGE